MPQKHQLLIAAVGVAGLAALTACGSSTSADADAAAPSKARSAPLTHTISGTISVQEFGGTVRGVVTGNPDIQASYMTMAQLQEDGRILQDLKNGGTYECPLGAGGGFSDIVPGAQVTVRDGGGQILGLGQLTGGKLDINGCTFDFTVPNLPDAQFYSVEVTHRGALSYSAADLEAKNWSVSTRV